MTLQKEGTEGGSVYSKISLKSETITLKNKTFIHF